MYGSASNVQNRPQMYRIGLKCTELASNVLCLKCTESVHLRPICTFEANLYIWGTVHLTQYIWGQSVHLRPICTFDAEYIWGQSVHLRPICTFEANLYIWGTVHLRHSTFEAVHLRPILYIWGQSVHLRPICTFEAQYIWGQFCTFEANSVHLRPICTFEAQYIWGTVHLRQYIWGQFCTFEANLYIWGTVHLRLIPYIWGWFLYIWGRFLYVHLRQIPYIWGTFEADWDYYPLTVTFTDWYPKSLIVLCNGVGLSLWHFNDIQDFNSVVYLVRISGREIKLKFGIVCFLGK